MKTAVLIPLLSLMLLGCFDDENALIKDTPTPLVELESAQNKIKISKEWTNDDISSRNKNLTQGLSIGHNSTLLYVAVNSTVYAIDKQTGEIVWKQTIESEHNSRERINKVKSNVINFLFGADDQPDTGNYEVMITAGPSANEDIVVVGGSRGEVIFLNASNGEIINQISYHQFSISSPPLIDGEQVLIKTTNSKIMSFNIKDGTPMWQYSQTNAPLTIQGIAPIIKHNAEFITGFDNGTLVFLDEDGLLINEKQIALPQGKTSLDRVIDIDSAAIVDGDSVFSVSYQGRLVSIDAESHKTKWLVDFSSLLGGGIIDSTLFLIDDETIVHGLSRLSGARIWQQNALQYRISTPAVLFNQLIVIADVEGYLHWLDPKDGSLIGRARISDEKIIKLSAIDQTLYVLDANDELFAIKVL